MPGNLSLKQSDFLADGVAAFSRSDGAHKHRCSPAPVTAYLVVVVHLHHVPLAVAHAAGDERRNRGLGLAWPRVKAANSSAKEKTEIARRKAGKQSYLQSR